MRISKIKIHNYRSIRDLEMECKPLVVMLGPNNHGKSNIISALEFALLTSAKPAPKDFCVFGEENKKLWVELTFHELTMQEKVTFNRYLRYDNSFCVRKTAYLNEAGSIEIFYNGYVTEPEEWWLKKDNIDRLTDRAVIDETPLNNLVNGRLTKVNIEEAQRQYINEHKEELNFIETLENGPFLGAKNIGGGVLPDFYLIPAVRDLSDETKVKTTTTFGRLLTRAVKEMAERDPRFQEIREGLENLVKTLNRREDGAEDRPEQLANLERALINELSYWAVNVEIEIIPPDVEKIFELGTNLHLDDGVKTLAEQKGHGLQRALIFALIRSWAQALRETRRAEKRETRPRASSDSIIFAMEEPEIYLHPHAQRKLAGAIQQISDTPNHQIFVSSHSTHFVDLDKYKNICIVIKPNPQEGTRVRQCTVDIFGGEDAADRKRRFQMARWVNPDRGEMFFAKKVAFVEGETEKIVLPYIAEKCEFFDAEVSIIDCGSKNNIPLYIKIANEFKIPYVVVHDEDPLPDTDPNEWSDEKKREKRRLYGLNKDIQNIVNPQLGVVEILSPDFEGVCGVSKTKGEKKGKALAALDHFQNKNPQEIPQRLKEVVEKIYKL